MEDFEVDFVSLSFTRTADDIVQTREFLDSAGLTTTKVTHPPVPHWIRFRVSYLTNPTQPYSSLPSGQTSQLCAHAVAVPRATRTEAAKHGLTKGQPSRQHGFTIAAMCDATASGVAEVGQAALTCLTI